MKLSEILKGVEVVSLKGEGDIPVRGISYDSRKTEKDYVFVAIEGFKLRGSAYIEDAVSRGARCIILDKEIDRVPGPGVTEIRVTDARKVLSRVSSNFYREPTREMVVVGVTGTNGKTTIAYLVESILGEAGISAALVGTVSQRGGGITREAVRTTPESLDLQEFFRNVRDRGVTHCVLEATSHALSLGRLDDVHFDVCLFSNITEEHMDFHKTLDNYKTAKANLFENLLEKSTKVEKSAVLNFDDPFSAELSLMTKSKIIKYGFGGDLDIRVCSFENTRSGLKARISVFGKTLDIESGLIGEFNLSNIMGAVGISYSLGIPHDAIIRGIKKLEYVPGRLEKVPNDTGVSVYVDYAHTDDALKNAISALDSIKGGKLITVFGCGGDRDREKRPRMGKVSTSMSDVTVVTSDNPRTEDPNGIIEDILRGIDTKSAERINGSFKNFERERRYYAIVPDRKEAISRAVAMASEGDSILIAGKGHETYQELRTGKIEFNDRRYAEEALKKNQ